MARKTIISLFVIFILILTAILTYEPTRTQVEYLYGKTRGKFTVNERLAQYEKEVEKRLVKDFEKADVSYPPKNVAYVVFKDTNLLEVYAKSSEFETWRFIRTYPVLKASGTLGPKLKEGDYQVPEGIYHSEFLNPNSRYHLAIRVNYPNKFDQDMARMEGRTQLGGDIMIHGSSVSIGCMAMGNPASEDLFTLAARTNAQSVPIIISPTDFRINKDYTPQAGPAWLDKLYTDIRAELKKFTK